MEGVPVDLQAKYHKLAAEYSKIRAQVSVLKRAVMDEQSRNAELRDNLKEREQSLRKVDQEMDSLTFRNQQLTKRVSVLQDELDSTQARGKKGKQKSSDGQQYPDLTNHVIDEEFQKKITENAVLLSKLQEKDILHEEEVAALTQRIERLEHELRQHHEVNHDAERKYKAVVEKLESERSTLQNIVEGKEKALEKTNLELVSLQQKHLQMHANLGSQLDKSNTIIREHLPFVDTCNEELNELNLPRHDRKQQIYSLHVVAQAGHHIRDMAAALSDYHTYTEQRLHALGSGHLSPINSKLSSHLKENARYLRGLEQGYSDFQRGVEAGEGLVSLETLPSLQCLATPLSAYASYLSKLLAYQRLSLEEENSQSACSEGLSACNNEIDQHITALATQFSKLDTYVKLLSAQSKRSCQHPPSSQRRFLLELTEVLRALHESMKDLYRSYSTKSTLEHETPITSERLQTTDECVVTSLAAMVASISKLSTVLSDSRAELCKNTSCSVASVKSVQAHPVVVSYKRKAAQYVSMLDMEEAPSVPYEEALKERDEARSSAVSCESLNEQLRSCQQRATRLEQEKEHWRLEFQLLQLKHSKIVKELEEQLRALGGSFSPGGDASIPKNKSGSTEQASVTNLLGRLQAPLQLTSEAEAREVEVKAYFKARIDELVAQSQMAETKAATLQAECLSLQKRLELCAESRGVCESSLQASQDMIARLHEELQTTTHNYETQLSIMSEHLANMNDKLTIQRDEIDQLKYQLTNKSSRKGKQK